VALAPIIPIGPRGQHHDPMTIPVRLRKIAEAVRQWIIAERVDGTDAPIAPVVNSAGRTSPCARAPLTGADLGRPTFRRLQLISRCSIRKDAERKGENRQEANHDQNLSAAPTDNGAKMGWFPGSHSTTAPPVRPGGVFQSKILEAGRAFWGWDGLGH
jgi:hypothetical protein